jgi:hypothetical protein
VQKIDCDCKFADMRSLCSDTNDLLPHITDIEQLYIKTKIACNLLYIRCEWTPCAEDQL